ncbi:MAG: histidine kinase [Bacteroidetes bacterium]|nr:histidine kinase [Bacteroidota bacterium]
MIRILNKYLFSFEIVMRISLIIILLISALFNVSALTEEEYIHTRDSLQQAYKYSRNIHQVDALFNLIDFIAPYEVYKCDSLITEELELAKSLNYPMGLAGTYQNLGSLFYYKNEMSKSLQYYFLALEIYEENNLHSRAGSCYVGLATVFYFTGNFDKMHFYLMKAIDKYQCDYNHKELAFTYFLIGFYYNTVNIKPIKAKYYHNKALKIGKEVNLAPLYITGFYSSLSVACKNNLQLDSAIYYLNKATGFLTDRNDDEILHKMINWADLGNLYLLKEKYDSAIFFYNKSIELANKFTYLFILPRCYTGIAEIHLKNSKKQEAMLYYHKAFEVLEDINSSGMFYSYGSKKYASDWLLDAWPGFTKLFTTKAKKFWAKKQLQIICYKLSQTYKQDGEYLQALQYYELYHIYSDSLNKIEKTRELINLEMNYQSEIKNKQIDNLSQENEIKTYQIRQSRNLIFGLIGLIALGIALIFSFTRQNNLKKEQERTSLQQRLFRTQMNPHFIFNSLSSIQHLVVNEDPEKASIYLAKFSTLVRSVLYSSNKDSISIDDELKTIESYLALQKIRYNNKFEYKIDIDPQIDTESLTIPPMLAQPFIENAIEHGIKHKKEKGNIDIRFLLINGSIHLEVEDDGVGRTKAQDLEKELKKDHQSMATDITRERLRILNKKLKEKINFSITDLKDNQGNPKGTKVSIILPINVL